MPAAANSRRPPRESLQPLQSLQPFQSDVVPGYSDRCHASSSLRPGPALPSSFRVSSGTIVLPATLDELADGADTIVYARVAAWLGAAGGRHAAGRACRVPRGRALSQGQRRADGASARSRRHVGALSYRHCLGRRSWPMGKRGSSSSMGREVPGRGWSGSDRACTASFATSRGAIAAFTRQSCHLATDRFVAETPQAGDDARRVRRTAGSDAHRAACAAGRRPMTRRVLVSCLLSIALVTGLALPVSAYLKFGIELKGAPSSCGGLRRRSAMR